MLMLGVFDRRRLAHLEAPRGNLIKDPNWALTSYCWEPRGRSSGSVLWGSLVGVMTRRRTFFSLPLMSALFGLSGFSGFWWGSAGTTERDAVQRSTDRSAAPVLPKSRHTRIPTHSAAYLILCRRGTHKSDNYCRLERHGGVKGGGFINS